MTDNNYIKVPWLCPQCGGPITRVKHEINPGEQLDEYWCVEHLAWAKGGRVTGPCCRWSQDTIDFLTQRILNLEYDYGEL